MHLSTEVASFPPPLPNPSLIWHPQLQLTSSKSLMMSDNRSPNSGNSSLKSAACMEELLVHCAVAIDSNDYSLSQQLLWVLHNIAHPDGDANERLTSAFLRALLLRVKNSPSPPDPPSLPRLSPVALASFIDLTPWHRFGYSAANSAIAAATDAFPVIHIVDLSTTHSMQLPTLIDSISSRHHPNRRPPFLRLTVPSPPPNSLLDTPVDELGARLVNFARSRNLSMEFNSVPSTPADGFHSLLHHLRLHQLVTDSTAEALVINCHMLLHYTPDETANNAPSPSPRDMFLKGLRELEPAVVILVDEDADFVDVDVVGRLRSAFNYLWIPFDAVETLLTKGSEERRRFEAAVSWKIENVIAQEGFERVERLEKKRKWVQRMKSAGFRRFGFDDEAVMEVKTMLDDHSAGWGMKITDEDLLLTWKGNDVVFATAWVPSTTYHS